MRIFLLLRLWAVAAAARALQPASASRTEGAMTAGQYVRGVCFAGAISCSVTHSLVVPLDVIKTCMQTIPGLGPAAAAAHIMREKGSRALLHGLGPTAIGYCLQGGAKFGGYEGLKLVGKQLFWERDGVIHEPRTLVARLPLMLSAAGIAELGACLLLCPLETGACALPVPRRAWPLGPAQRGPACLTSPLARAAKLRIQTEMGSGGLARVLSGIVREDGFKALYRGFTPIALRQVRQGQRASAGPLSLA